MSDPRIALGTFSLESGPAFVGLLLNGSVFPAAQILTSSGVPIPAHLTMIDLLERWEVAWPALLAFGDAAPVDRSIEPVDLNSLTVLSPVLPRQIICVGANYRRHVIELMTDHEGASALDQSPQQRRAHAERLMDHRAAQGQPFAFIKPISAVLAPFGNLELPTDAAQIDWELELAVVIGRSARRVRRAQAMEHVAGFTIANDITARDRLARRDFPTLGLDWLAGKSAPGFLPLGPYIIPSGRVADPQDLTITLSLNGNRMQHESTSDMIFPVARLIEHISTYMTLLPGDVICTGSPSGNGTHYNRFLQPGDIMEGHIEGLGVQRISCVAEEISPLAPTHRPFAPLPELFE